VQGLSDLQRAFRAADKATSKELRDGLRKAADPVRSDAERRAVGEIPRIGVPWSRMRVGVTMRSVYVAPVERGARGTRSRKNLAGLLLEKAMIPALEANIGQVVDEVDDVLQTVGRVWENE
jgi:hypothetical protein